MGNFGGFYISVLDELSGQILLMSPLTVLSASYCGSLGAHSLGSLVDTRLEDYSILFLKVYSRNKPVLLQHLMGIKSTGPDYNLSEVNPHNLCGMDPRPSAPAVFPYGSIPNVPYYC